MTPADAITWARNTWTRHTRCNNTTHQLDWPLFFMLGVAKCAHCSTDMTEPPASTVGRTHPDSGD